MPSLPLAAVMCWLRWAPAALVLLVVFSLFGFVVLCGSTRISDRGNAFLPYACGYYNQLLQHGFHTTWRGGLRVSTSSSAARATALIAVIVQTGCGFLSGGRRGATLDDREDCFGRATVALRRAIQHTYIVSPVDMAGLIGMAQTLAVFHSGYHTLKRRQM